MLINNIHFVPLMHTPFHKHRGAIPPCVSFFSPLLYAHQKSYRPDLNR